VPSPRSGHSASDGDHTDQPRSTAAELASRDIVSWVTPRECPVSPTYQWNILPGCRIIEGVKLNTATERRRFPCPRWPSGSVSGALRTVVPGPWRGFWHGCRTARCVTRSSRSRAGSLEPAPAGLDSAGVTRSGRGAPTTPGPVPLAAPGLFLPARRRFRGRSREDSPSAHNRSCGVRTLSPVDPIASQSRTVSIPVEESSR
jgi:hypothetical protein